MPGIWSQLLGTGSSQLLVIPVDIYNALCYILSSVSIKCLLIWWKCSMPSE